MQRPKLSSPVPHLGLYVQKVAGLVPIRRAPNHKGQLPLLYPRVSQWECLQIHVCPCLCEQQTQSQELLVLRVCFTPLATIPTSVSLGFLITKAVDGVYQPFGI